MTTESPRKLYRSGVHRMIGGVCGGLAEYFALDPTLVRVLWLIFTVFTGIGIPVYFICLIIVPNNPDHKAIPQAHSIKSENIALIIGITLVVVGVSLFYDHTFPHFWSFGFPGIGYWPFQWRYIWPVLLILFGFWYIFHNLQKEKNDTNSNPSQPAKGYRLYRSQKTRMIGGVCSGMAKYWNIDVTIVRVIFVVLTLITNFFLGIGVYIIALMVIPVEEEEVANGCKPRV
jgi:phage shock protein C